MAHGAINALFSVIIDPAAFDDVDAFEHRTRDFYDFIKKLNPAKGTDEVLMPGEPEIRSREERWANGIDVDDETIRQLMEIGGEFKLAEGELKSLLINA